MAHGIRQGEPVALPKIWGKEFEKDGAACIAAK